MPVYIHDKIRMHDTKQVQTHTLDSSQQEQLMLTQPRDPNNKNKPSYKNTVIIVIEQITPSLLVPKNNVMMRTKEMLMLDQNFFRNHLYSTFVLLPTEQNDMINHIKVEVHHEIYITTKITIHKTDIVLRQEIDSAMTKILLPHNTHDMTNINEIRDTNALLTILIQIPF